MAQATGIERTVEAVTEEAIVRAIESPAVERALARVLKGPVVVTEALLAEVGSGRIAAALDVTDPEPLPDGHPLWTAPGVLITPHVAGSVRRYTDRAWRFCGEQIERFMRGEPLLNVVSDGY